MSEELNRLDEKAEALLGRGQVEASCRPAVRNELYELLRGVVVAFVLHELELRFATVPLDVRHEETSSHFVVLLSRAFEHLERHNWRLGDGFGIVNPRKRVKDPAHFRRCLTAAVSRDARKGCQVWQSEHAGGSDPSILLDQESTSPDPQSIVANLELTEDCFALLSSIPVRLREPYVYNRLLGWSLRIVARILGTNHVEVSRRVEEVDAIVRKRFGEAP